MSKLVDFVDSIVDNRGKNPPYYSVNYEYPVIDNFLINGERYPNINRVKRFIDKNIFDTFIRKYLKKDDVVITLVGNGVGSCCLVPADNWVIIQNTIGLKTKPSVYNRYLYYYLKLNKNRIALLDGGSSQPNVRVDNFLQIEVNFQNFDEQKKIAETLYILDSKIELNNRINAELEALAKTLYDYWFVQFDFPDKNGNPYKTSGGKMVWNETLKREIPEGWEDGTLSDISEIIGGSTPSKAIEDNFCQDIGLPWITPKDLSLNKGKKYITRGEWNVTERGLREASLKIMPPGTVLLSSRAPIGYLAIARTDVTTNQGFKSFIPKGIFNSEFIFYTIQNLVPEIEANSSGSTFKEVSSGTLKTIKTILPKEIVLSEFNEKIKPIFKRQDKLELENQKLAELRDWLLPMLMNGQVKVN